jgi:hypothetical protein
VLRQLPADRPVVLVGDDTVDGHKGKHVWGKARHRDPVRSTKSYTAWRPAPRCRWRCGSASRRRRSSPTRPSSTPTPSTTEGSRQGPAVSGGPRADPYVRHYRIRL